MTKEETLYQIAKANAELPAVDELGSGHRMSSLNLAARCGLAPELDKLHGAGRAAALSTVLHAKAAGEKDYPVMYARLTDDEQADVDARHVPIVTEVKAGPEPVLLEYKDAEKEVTLSLNADGQYTDDFTTAVTVGHADMCWHVGDTVYINDIKANRFTVSEDINEYLQTSAYGIAYATKVGADYYVPGLFFSADNEWVWGDRVELFSPKGERITARVLAAATNDEKVGNTGDHCSSCYSRMSCPEFCASGAVADTWLAPLTEGVELTADVAEQMLERVAQAKEVVKAAESLLKVYAERNDGIPVGEDKVWKPVFSKGRASLDKRLLEEKYPGAIEACTVKGKGHSTFRKVKRK